MPAGGGSADSGNARTTCSRSTSRIFGTHTSTETRRDLISRRMSCGLKLRVKITRAAHHRRNVGRHRLAEHVAERQQVDEAQRMERPRVPPVLHHLALDRDDVRQDVAVADDDALRLGRGAGREDDLDDVVARDRRRPASARRRASRSRRTATRSSSDRSGSGLGFRRRRRRRSSISRASTTAGARARRSPADDR